MKKEKVIKEYKISVIDISHSQLPALLTKVLPVYQDQIHQEHLYCATQILEDQASELSDTEIDLINEVQTMQDKSKACYFRITK